MKIYQDGTLRFSEPLATLTKKYELSKSALKKWTVQEDKGKTSFVPLFSDPPIQAGAECKVVYEDDACLVAYKPAYLLVHSDGNGEETLQDQVDAYLASQRFPFKAQAVHRLDYETCGLVLFCKIPLLQNYFDQQFRNHSILKEYYCILDGKVDQQKKVVQKKIGKDRHDAHKMIVYAKGKEAKTTFYRMKEKDGHTLMKVKIEHGRRHQIRVHAASLGFPILHDVLYGKKGSSPLCLECFHLVFHSLDSKKVDVKVDLDQNLAKFM